MVSEISEATASSPVRAEERVNFHIGNPVQDPRLVELYARIALGLAPGKVSAAGDLAAALTAEFGGDEEGRVAVEFLLDLIRKSAPYLPRGGFLKSKPGELVRLFGDWLTRQPEPLGYDFGEKSGRREVILASGGVTESLRVFFHGLASQLQRLPASVFSHGIQILPISRISSRSISARFPRTRLPPPGCLRASWRRMETARRSFCWAGFCRKRRAACCA